MKSIDEYIYKHKDLMLRWKNKYPNCVYFTEDGIVNPNEWFKIPHDKRIVFLLKEAYTSEEHPLDWNEAKWLNNEPCRENCPYNKDCSKLCPIKGNSFNRIAEWTYCITELSHGNFLLNSTPEGLLDHIYWLGVHDKSKSKKQNNAAYQKKRSALLKKIAIVNLKKIDGTKSSNPLSLTKHATLIDKLLLEQLELIQPNYVICCGTWNYLDASIQNYLSEKYAVIKTPHPNAYISKKRILTPVLEYLLKDK